MLRKWLKSGYMEKNILYPTEEGTPQGGIISPVLANMALDGLEQELYQRYRRRIAHLGKMIWANPQTSQNRKIMYIRYADDFIIAGISKEFLEEEVKPFVREF